MANAEEGVAGAEGEGGGLGATTVVVTGPRPPLGWWRGVGRRSGVVWAAMVVLGTVVGRWWVGAEVFFYFSFIFCFLPRSHV